MLKYKENVKEREKDKEAKERICHSQINNKINKKKKKYIAE